MRRLREVQKHRYPDTKVRILDVGCADGSFMHIVKKHIPDLDRIDGCDVPSKWSEGYSAQGIGTVYIQDLQQGVGEIPVNNYHIITLWEVIEHIENAYLFLRNLQRLLAPDGIVMLSSPNLISLSRFIKGRDWVGIKEQDHKYLFDLLSLTMLLSRTGFHKIKVKSYFLPSLAPSFDWLNESLSLFPAGGMLLAQASNENHKGV